MSSVCHIDIEGNYIVIIIVAILSPSPIHDTAKTWKSYVFTIILQTWYEDSCKNELEEWGAS